MSRDVPVDESLAAASPRELCAAAAVWLGVVVSRRHARRSVTRSLLKREIRAGFARHCERLARGMWVVRLRAPFDVKRYPSAASSALRCAARDELETLLVGAVRARSAG